MTRNLREALPASERSSLVAGSDFWDDHKVMFEHATRTPQKRIVSLAEKLTRLPVRAQSRALDEIEARLDSGLYTSVGPGDTPTYVRGSQ